MSWNQLVAPNPATQDYAGMCLRFAQSVFNAPVRYRSATEAWNNTAYKHADWDLPPQGIAHPVWFSHWGTYGSPPSYENWGHICIRMEDGRLLSSPGSGYGQAWFNSIGEVERYFNAKYVGWSEDLNGLKVIDYSAPQPLVTGEDDMYAVAQYDDGWAGLWNMATGQTHHIDTVDEWNRIAGSGNLKIWKFADAAAFNAWKAKYGTVLPLNVDTTAIAQAVVAELGNVQIDVDTLANAIAEKVDCTCDCGCGIPKPETDVTTKAEIIASIEANYPEDTK